MDLTKSLSTGNEAVVAKEQHDPVPLHGSGVAAGGFPVDFEAFKLKDGKWKPLKKEVFLGMITNHIILQPLVLKTNGVYYCGSDPVWNTLVEKGDARRWLHDLIIDCMLNDYPRNWLHLPLKELLAI